MGIAESREVDRTVRAAASLGLCEYGKRIRDAVESVATKDPDEMVRLTAKDAVKGLFMISARGDARGAATADK